MSADSKMRCFNWRTTLLALWGIGVPLYFALVLHRFDQTLWFQLFASLSLIASFILLWWITRAAYRMTSEVRRGRDLSAFAISLIASLAVGAVLIIVIGRFASFLTPYNLQGEFASLAEAKFRDAIRYLATALLPWSIAVIFVSRVARTKENVQKQHAFVLWVDRISMVAAITVTLLMLGRAW